MGIETDIGWCDSTVNPTSGCDGCELWNRSVRTCYAGNLHEHRMAKALPHLYAPNFKEVRTIPGRIAKAANWPDLRGKARPTKPWMDGLPRFIFVGDMGDLLSSAVTDDYLLVEIFAAITSKAGQRHFWLLLTKRPRRLARIASLVGGLPSNVMAMTTVTSQQTADLRLPALHSIPCHWRGISAEPLLEAVTLTSFPPVDWIITGGESGESARPTQTSAFNDLHSQCNTLNIPFFFKQAGGKDKQKGGSLLNGQFFTGMPKI